MGRTSHEELIWKLEEAMAKVPVGSKHYFWKNPDVQYEIVSLGFTEWDEEIVVVYKPLDEEITWVRRLEGESGWLTPVDSGTDDTRRFIPVEE